MIKHTSIALATLAGATAALTLDSNIEAAESVTGPEYKLSGPDRYINYQGYQESNWSRRVNT